MRAGLMRTATLLAALLTLGVVAGCGGGGSSAQSSAVRSETRSISGVTSVVFSGIGNLSIKQAGTESLKVTAPQNVLPQITTTVSGNQLTIGYTGSSSSPAHANIAYTLLVTGLTSVELSGAGNIFANGISSPAITIKVPGAGSVTASGNAQSQTIDISGAGRFDGSSFVGATATVDVSGAGSALVKVLDHLDARVSGVGTITYIGTPTVTKTVTGAGTVTQQK